MKNLLHILLCLPIVGLGQCENKCNEIINYTNAKYTGCINEKGNPDGYGKLIFNNQQSYIGCWKDGKEEGQGTYTFENGSKNVGVFKNGNIWDGISIFHQETGTIYKIYYKNGSPKDTIRNDRNYYIKEDISGDEIYCTKKLVKQKDQFTIRCNINNTTVKWIFDTGAESISIGKNEWNKIKSKIDFEDLDISAQSKGVGGFQSGRMIRIKDEIEIGCYFIKNTVVYITNGEHNLMGIGFLKKFSNVEWNMKESHLKLYK